MPLIRASRSGGWGLAARRLLPALLLGGVLALGPAAAARACGPFSLAFYELGLLYYRDASGKAHGIDLDLVDALAARSGCRFVPVLESRVRIWSQLADGRLDLSVSGIATPERERFAEFMPYFQTRNFLMLRRNVPAAAHNPDGFVARPELRIAVVKSFKHGPRYDAWLARLRERPGRVVEAADFDTVLRLFSVGRVDAFLSLPTSWLLAARRQGLDATVTMLDWSPEDRVVHGLIVSLQRVPEVDRRRLSQALDSLHADGTVARILRRHAGPEWADKLVLARP